MRKIELSPSENFYWPMVLAVGLHVIVFAALFVSWTRIPEYPPSRPIIQATLYQLQSKSMATAQTNQRIAGEAEKTQAPQHEVDQLEQQKREQKAARRQEAERRAVETQKAAEAKQAEQARQAAEKAQQEKQAEIARKKAEEDQKAAEQAKKKAAEEAKKKAAEEAKKKAAEEAKKKADAQKKRAEEAARKAAEDKKAQAQAELLGDSVQRGQTLADAQGSPVGSLDDLIRRLVAERWNRPASARNGMTVVLQIQMLPDGTVTHVSVNRSSGDAAFDNSAVAAVRNVARIPDMQQLKGTQFEPYRRFLMTFRPEDLQ